jgi:hypothetical protein
MNVFNIYKMGETNLVHNIEEKTYEAKWNDWVNKKACTHP